MVDVRGDELEMRKVGVHGVEQAGRVLSARECDDQARARRKEIGKAPSGLTEGSRDQRSRASQRTDRTIAARQAAAASVVAAAGVALVALCPGRRSSADDRQA